MFTIKSTSDEGVYFLVNGWREHRAFWVLREDLTLDMLFRREADARRSLTKLLRVMPEYAGDKFELVEVCV